MVQTGAMNRILMANKLQYHPTEKETIKRAEGNWTLKRPAQLGILSHSLADHMEGYVFNYSLK